MPLNDINNLKRFKDILSKHYLIRSNATDDRRTFLGECNAEHFIDRIKLDAPTQIFVSNLTNKLRNRKELFSRFLEAFGVLYEDDYEKEDIEFVKYLTSAVSRNEPEDPGSVRPGKEKAFRAVVPATGKADPRKVFISYAKEDLEHALRLYRDLKSRGIKAWIDREDIVPGQRWKDAIRKAIVGCDYFIALLSKRATTKKRFVHTELKYAVEVLESLPRQEIFVIPALLEECDVEDEMLKQIHWAYLYPSYEKGVADIMRALTPPKSSGETQDSEQDAAVSAGGMEDGKILVVQEIVGNTRVFFEFAYIPPGEFMMGSPEEEPERSGDEILHKVVLTEGFFMQTTLVTQGQWKAVMGKNPSWFKEYGGKLPMETVSWEDAMEYIGKLNAAGDGKGYRLPTEAQWEYACRAGTTTAFHTGRCLSTDEANYNGHYPLDGCPKEEYQEKATTQVKTFPPNAWGLYDMHGNLWEWCSDWHDEYGKRGAVVDPPGPPSGSDRVLRGGSWSFSAWSCRSAYRNWDQPGERNEDIGFRLVLPSKV